MAAETGRRQIGAVTMDEANSQGWGLVWLLAAVRNAEENTRVQGQCRILFLDTWNLRWENIRVKAIS